jgi:hypothetical protein
MFPVCAPYCVIARYINVNSKLFIIVDRSLNLNASNLGRLIYYGSCSTKPLQYFSSFTAFTWEGSHPSATIVKVKHLMIVAVAFQLILDAGTESLLGKCFIVEIL